MKFRIVRSHKNDKGSEEFVPLPAISFNQAEKLAMLINAYCDVEPNDPFLWKPVPEDYKLNGKAPLASSIQLR